MISLIPRVMSGLPHDIIVEILLRLPVKSLIQFKCVSKPWLSLISDPKFVKLHLNQAISDLESNHFRLFTLFPFQSLDYESASSLDLGFPVKEPNNGVKIMGSCHGLICLLYYPDCTILWNPSTRDSKELPRSPYSSTDISFSGLGYDSSIDDYKVVRAAHSMVANETKFDVFNLKANCWRRIEERLHSSITILHDQGTFLNGALHWRASRDTGPNEHDVIISLDLAKEKFGLILQPEVDDMNISFHTLGTWQGFLSLCSYGYGLHVGIWAMKEYGVRSSWTKVVTLPCIEFEYCDYMVPVCFTKKGEVIVDLDGRNLVGYNIEEKTSRNLKSCSDDWFQWTVYVESLVSPCNKID